MPHTIRTDRLVLQPMGLRHARALWHEVRDYAVLQNTSIWPYPLSYAHTSFMVAKSRPEDPATDRVFAMVKAGAVAGSLGLHQRRDDLWTIGYMLGKRFWGQGLATEAARAICSFGFQTLRVKTILAEVYTDNQASEKVLTKVDFVKQPGLQMGYSTARRAHQQITTWAITRQEFRP